MNLEQRIKQHEGFRNTVYKDTLGKRTVGWGHLCRADETWEDDVEYPKDVLQHYFDIDFDIAIAGGDKLCGNMGLPERIEEVVIEMCFQLGVNGVSKFKKMLKALQVKNYRVASIEMLDSRWAKQTPERAKELSETVRRENEKI